jgi:hypothetical protein
MRRKSLSLPKQRSMTLRFLYAFFSCRMRYLRLDLPGMTSLIPSYLRRRETHRYRSLYPPSVMTQSAQREDQYPHGLRSPSAIAWILLSRPALREPDRLKFGPLFRRLLGRRRDLDPATANLQHMHDPAQNQPIVFAFRCWLVLVDAARSSPIAHR